MPADDARRAADIFVAFVMTVGIVDVFQVIQIQHDEGGDAQLFRTLEKLAQPVVKGTAVKQARHEVVVPLVLDFSLLLDFLGDVGEGADDFFLVLQQLEPDPAAAVLPLQAINPQVALLLHAF